MPPLEFEIGEFDATISVPLDSAGFLRRACPTCARELKWKPEITEGARRPDPEDGYVCPYCGIRSPVNSWWTEAQLALARAQAIREIVDPEVGRPVDTGGPPPGFVPIDITASPPEDPPPLLEPDDMREVGFACHRQMPVKVADDWPKPLHCPLCGELGGEWAEEG